MSDDVRCRLSDRQPRRRVLCRHPPGGSGPPPARVTCRWPFAPGMRWRRTRSAPAVTGSLSPKAHRNGRSKCSSTCHAAPVRFRSRVVRGAWAPASGTDARPALYVSSTKGASYAAITSSGNSDTVAPCRILPIGNSGTSWTEPLPAAERFAGVDVAGREERVGGDDAARTGRGARRRGAARASHPSPGRPA